MVEMPIQYECNNCGYVLGKIATTHLHGINVIAYTKSGEKEMQTHMKASEITPLQYIINSFKNKCPKCGRILNLNFDLDKIKIEVKE